MFITMKLESDPPFYPSTTSPSCGPESIECNYNTELQHQIMSINPIGLSFQDKINHEDAIQSPYSTGDGNSCMTTKINDSSTDGFNTFMSPSSKKSSNSYVDKSVLEFQMSKTIVCDKETYVNDVKDICIDEGVSSLDNFFFRSTNDTSTSIYKILPLEQNEGSIKEKKNCSEVSKSISDAQKISLEDHFAMDWSTHNDDKDLKQLEEAKLDLSEPQVSVQKLVRKSHSSESLDKIGVEISGEKANSKDPASNSESVESCNGNSDPGSAAESPNDNIPTHSSAYNHKFENESIKLNFNSISPAANGGEEHHVNTNSNYLASMDISVGTQECCGSIDSAIGTQVSTSLEFRTSDSRLVPSQTPPDIGESSFSAVDPLASLVTYSGPIAYSGSVSLRSESSTTSTRSFAFPILQSEWNTSPVKMVKAERRHYRKYRDSMDVPPLRHVDRQDGRWRPPPIGVLKLNTDGAWKKSDGSGGAGWILRDHTGYPCLHGNRNNFKSSSALVTKGEAIRDGLKHIISNALNLGPSILVESDNRMIIDVILGVSQDVSELSNVIADIGDLVSLFRDISFCVCRRIGNRAADALSKSSDVFSSDGLQLCNNLARPDIETLLRWGILPHLLPL